MTASEQDDGARPQAGLADRIGLLVLMLNEAEQRGILSACEKLLAGRLDDDDDSEAWKTT